MQRLPLLGIVISAVCLAAVVWWALRQGTPELPHTAAEWGSLVGAIALYGVNTLVRSERWHRLLLDDGAHPARVDSYSLTTSATRSTTCCPRARATPRAWC